MSRFRVVICGGGIAAVEGLLRLRSLAGDALEITLVAPAEELRYRPLAVDEPFAIRGVRRYPLRTIAQRTGAEWVQDAAEWLDPDGQLVNTQGGVRGRREATGRGLFFALREACSRPADMARLGLATGLEGKRIVVQGLGNVGYHAAKFCREGGAILTAIAEREGAIANPKGLNEDEVFQHRKKTGSILDFPGASNVQPTEAALEIECDVLLPAALEGVFTAENAPRVKAKIILEGANGPTTPAADPIFREKGILVIPDIYANAGGVTVSYFEWVKNLSHVRFGRLSKRHEMANELAILRVIEAATGKTFTDAERMQIAKGPDEQDLVNSGLEETMILGVPGAD